MGTNKPRGTAATRAAEAATVDPTLCLRVERNWQSGAMSGPLFEELAQIKGRTFVRQAVRDLIAEAGFSKAQERGVGRLYLAGLIEYHRPRVRPSVRSHQAVRVPAVPKHNLVRQALANLHKGKGARLEARAKLAGATRG
jgi:hypothetical protein